MMKIPKKKVILIIRDGWGFKEAREGNAIAQANTPVHDVLREECARTILAAAGVDVGLPPGFMGNSEVGHLNLGAGRVVEEMMTRIDTAIQDGSFFTTPPLLKAIKNCSQHNSALHIMGLLSDAGVHSMNHHLYALLKLTQMHHLPKVYIHLFADGRDSPVHSVGKYVVTLKDVMAELKCGRIATIQGRYYAMDRDERWDREKLSYECIVDAQGRKAETVEHAIHTAYEQDERDEFITPTVIGNYAGVQDHDSLIFFNFRLDRARQLTQAFIDPGFTKFKRRKCDIVYVAMCEYYDTIEKSPHAYVVYHPLVMQNLLGEIMSQHNLKQLRIAETEKYAHVTYFFNGEEERPYPREDRILIPSPKVATYDATPAMSAHKITENVLEKMQEYDFVVLNFANADMVGHTGNLNAAIQAVEVLDTCIGTILKKVRDLGWVAIITSDHGNAEEMQGTGEEAGDELTRHTTNPVDTYVYNYPCKLRAKGRLTDVAPTILEIMGLAQPNEMTGRSLILHQN